MKAGLPAGYSGRPDVGQVRAQVGLTLSPTRSPPREREVCLQGGVPQGGNLERSSRQPWKHNETMPARSRDAPTGAGSTLLSAGLSGPWGQTECNAA